MLIVLSSLDNESRLSDWLIEVGRTWLLELWANFVSSEISRKMRAELAQLLVLFSDVEKSCGCASLSLSTSGASPPSSSHLRLQLLLLLQLQQDLRHLHRLRATRQLVVDVNAIVAQLGGLAATSGQLPARLFWLRWTLPRLHLLLISHFAQFTIFSLHLSCPPLQCTAVSENCQNVHY